MPRTATKLLGNLVINNTDSDTEISEKAYIELMTACDKLRNDFVNLKTTLDKYKAHKKSLHNK